MAKIHDLTVEVSARLTVSKDSAERCLRLLEMYMKDNPRCEIVCHCSDNLTREDYHLELEEMHNGTI